MLEQPVLEDVPSLQLLHSSIFPGIGNIFPDVITNTLVSLSLLVSKFTSII